MKILMCLFLLFFPMVSMADANDDMKIQILDSQIESLTKERDEKYAKLKQCEKTTQGFKIAGLSTLVATGVGVYGNIKLAQRLRDGKSGSSNNGGLPGDTRPDEVIANYECQTDPGYCCWGPEEEEICGEEICARKTCS